MRTTAAVTEERGAPFTIQDVDIDDPRSGEVRVEIVACGVCHMHSMQARDGDLPFPFAGRARSATRAAGRRPGGRPSATGRHLGGGAATRFLFGWPWRRGRWRSSTPAGTRSGSPGWASTTASPGDQMPTTPDEIELYAAFESLIRLGWARPTPEFRRVFSSMMIPGGTEEQMRWLDDLQRMAVDAETALLALSQRRTADSTARLAELDLRPWWCTAVGDQLAGVPAQPEAGGGIRGARLVPLPSTTTSCWPTVVLAAVPARGDRVRRPGPGGRAGGGGRRRAGLAAVAPRARHPPPGRPRVRQRRIAAGAGPVRQHAAPAERGSCLVVYGARRRSRLLSRA